LKGILYRQKKYPGYSMITFSSVKEMLTNVLNKCRRKKPILLGEYHPENLPGNYKPEPGWFDKKELDWKAYCKKFNLLYIPPSERSYYEYKKHNAWIDYLNPTALEFYTTDWKKKHGVRVAPTQMLRINCPENNKPKKT
jgi:hypothetical protein